MTLVVVPLLLALLQLEEMDILEHEPNEQHEALEEEELDDIDPDTGKDDCADGDAADDEELVELDGEDWEDVIALTSSMKSWRRPGLRG